MPWLVLGMTRWMTLGPCLQGGRGVVGHRTMQMYLRREATQWVPGIQKRADSLVRRDQAWPWFQKLPGPRSHSPLSSLHKGEGRGLGAGFKPLSKPISELGFSTKFSFIYVPPGEIFTLCDLDPSMCCIAWVTKLYINKKMEYGMCKYAFIWCIYLPV